jgi:serine protease Do
MNIGNVTLGARATRAGLAALAAVLISGASWHGLAARAANPVPPAVSAAGAAPASIAARDSYADVVDQVSPAVVTIRVESTARMSPTALQEDDLFRRFFGEPFGNAPRRTPAPLRRGLGSGVVVSGDGYILTNHHVIDGADRIRVDFTDGRTMDAALVGSDEPTDLALLKVEATGLPTIVLGDSDKVRVGDVVLAVGNPLGVGQTVTLGIVSAKGRFTGVGDGSYEDFLQTDAPINQGNSGGALVSTRGELVGINSQILSPSGGNIGIGFAIPANMARHVMTELRTEGRVRRGQLGVTIQPLTSDMAESLGVTQVKGAIVSAVDAGSAADRAGVKRGDIITSFNGQSVSDTNALRNRVAESKPGASAELTIVRDGKERAVSVKLGEAASSRTDVRGRGGEADDQTALGVAVAPLTPELARRAGLPADAKGLLVQQVDPEGRAARAGIQGGDVIQEANRKPMTSVDDLRAALRESADRPVLLLVSREGRTSFVTVRPS